MKKITKVFLVTLGLASFGTYSCKESFLDRPPLGAIAETSLTNAAGVNGALISAYRSLGGSNVAAWYTSPMNWVWGGVRSDDAYKGTESTDQGAVNPIERFEVLPNNGPVLNKWRACYDGIGMANTTLQLLAQAKDLSDAQKKQVEAESRFIRAYHHFEAKRTFNNVPFVDEKAVTIADLKLLSNDKNIYPTIEAEFKFAFDNLPATQAQIGRVNKWTAGAFLAKVFMYQNKFAEAKVLYDQIIANGVTSGGQKYGLLANYGDVFKGDFESAQETIFSIQYTVGDGTGGANSNKDGELTNPHNDGPVGCCGFYQPAQSLVNAFKTGADGLPLSNYNASDVKNHENSPADFPDRGRFDPRLDHTVGRAGVPFLDWGAAKSSWIRNLANGGPYMPKKHIHYKSEAGKYFVSGGWGQGQSGKNQLTMRFSDLLLMAAECEVEVGTLAKAQEYVNLVRNRAKGSMVVMDGATPAANYVVNPYTAAWTDKTAARNAVRFERYVELGMEGHRFFDLVRWGIADQVKNEFFTREGRVRTHLAGARFTKGKDEYLPIPEYVLAQSTSGGKAAIVQNPGY
ncbi:MAG: RagB/SusD family nutrient uptake outer membrane protein [Cytophagia bacterium]|nr:MAG: RagB/SusD family nutrient uptake outer membrane protein [Cytophagales bacterium]TAG41356.1 MAG: RagB/SusD family nutrient uptake outer membrane protein [Cytophagia bacterium]TAG51051.1 MAG: RagB/SusD family nutrient uptake outer membrane protein [Runella slithyformis]TAG75115.1 MAG: RagB/SusD family nutrient uptake outer membrane protein [Runella slithyformis]TAG83114.1 MAG: RagB/SusD family nutrient uptake outer membrane protein [Cytophagales bacterium]